jgi:CRISPR-associated protein Cas5 subtype I-B
MEKILVFNLKGKFAHFRYPFTSPNKLKKTYILPPKSTILGMLGSIIGLEGFQNFENRDFEPQYYKSLKHIKLYIGLYHLPLKKLIQYNSLNSFSKNIEKDPNVIIKEEILLNPIYQIGLLLDDNLIFDKLILESIGQKCPISNYHIYLGKNEFFANISNVKTYNNSEFTKCKVNFIENLNSIIYKKYIDFDETKDDLIFDTFSKSIDFVSGKLKTNNEEICFSISMENEIYLKDYLDLYSLGNKYYFFF